MMALRGERLITHPLLGCAEFQARRKRKKEDTTNMDVSPPNKKIEKSAMENVRYDL